MSYPGIYTLDAEEDRSNWPALRPGRRIVEVVSLMSLHRYIKELISAVEYEFFEKSKNKKTCQDVVKEAKVSEREAPSVTEKFFVIISRVLPSQLSAVWPVVVVSSVFLV